MPFRFDHTTPGGTNYPDSFWVISAVNLNHLGQSAVVIMNGYADVETFNSGGEPFSQQQIVFNDSEIYRLAISIPFQTNWSGVDFSFYWYLETALPQGSGYANLGTFEEQYSITGLNSLEIGAEADDIVAVAFSNELTGYSSAAGVTIRVNGSPATISSASLDGNYSFPHFGVAYDLSADVQLGDEVTWEYDGGAPGSGTLTDPGLLPVRKFEATPVVNTIGFYLKFNRKSNSGHIVSVL